MELWLSIYAVLMAILGLYSAVNITLNLLYFRRLGKVSRKDEGPLISIVIPARNEEKNIGKLLDSLIVQDYSNIEILVINDQSTDRTGEILEEYAARDSRIRIFETENGKKLNSNGKINALLQLIPHATGEYIIATDADTIHAPDCVSHAYSVMKTHNLDIISGFPKEICSSYFGSICISAMMLTYVFVPQWLVYRFPIPAATFAIGQFIMMRKDAYDETGGYDRLRNEICDDIGIVRLFVRSGKRYAFLDMSSHSSCVMYRTGKESFNGIERSIAGVIPTKASLFIPIAIIVLLLLHIAFSPIAAIMLLIFSFSSKAILMTAGSILVIAAWYAGCKSARWRKRISIACPFTILVIVIMYLHSFLRSITGKGFEWKGRIVGGK